MTDLDEAYARMAGGDDAAGLLFYRSLADTTLFVVLEREAEGAVVAPRVFDLEAGPVILAFDSEERLGSLGPEPLAYAALPGRIVAQQMMGQAVSLGLNLGTGAVSEVLLPPEAMDWLVQMLGSEPSAIEARAEAFYRANVVPPALSAALQHSVAGAVGLAAAALFAEVRYHGGRQGHVFAFVNADPGSEAALARSVAEALAFSGIEAGELDVMFLRDSDPALRRLLSVAQVFEVPQPVVSSPEERRAPGTDPAAPPKLR